MACPRKDDDVRSNPFCKYRTTGVKSTEPRWGSLFGSIVRPLEAKDKQESVCLAADVGEYIRYSMRTEYNMFSMSLCRSDSLAG